jgi:hypothetical protein
MSESHRALSSEHIVATVAVASALFSLLAVGVTLYVAYVQDRATERQNEYSRALWYSGIYFSDQVSQARDMVDAAYFADYDTIRKSPDPNGAVARLLRTSAQQLAFDKLLAIYEQIAACANTKVCSADVTRQLYGRDIKSLFQKLVRIHRQPARAIGFAGIWLSGSEVSPQNLPGHRLFSGGRRAYHSADHEQGG